MSFIKKNNQNSQSPCHSWRESIRVYRHPKIIGMLFLGFSAGLPLLLVGGTFTAWLRDIEIELATIGFLSWVGMAHSIKILWAPVVDRLKIPFLSKALGRRRAWMISAQILIALSFLGISLSNPEESLFPVAIFAILAALGSATQDIAVDAYRIEAVSKERQGAMAATYVFGYRIALLAAGAGALHIASAANWNTVYICMMLFMSVGIITTLIIKEPQVHIDKNTAKIEQQVIEYLSRTTNKGKRKEVTAWIISAVICPLSEFIKRNKLTSIAILAFIATFRISDIFMGVMANPFYLDLGFTKTQIGNIAAAFGLAMTLTGATIGGLLVMRFGIMRMLIISSMLAPITNLTFSWLATLGPQQYGLILAIMADNISAGIASAVFIAYLSSLTNIAYTATQYALFSSIMSLPGQFLAGFTGILVENIGWIWFFISSALIGIPAIILAFVLKHLSNPDQKNTTQ